MPWRDPAGRFSPFKLAVFLLLFMPAALVAYRFAAGLLGPRAINEGVHQIGNWTLRLVLLSLLVTPGRRLLQWPRLMQVRRMVGVAAFAYAMAHLLLYAADRSWDLGKVATEIVLRVYLAIGFAALLILLALAVTSTYRMARRLGGRHWRRLHWLVYPAALLSIVHFFLQTKVAVDEPWLMAGLLGWLLGYRVVAWRGGLDGRVAAWWTVLLALLAAAGTALGEAMYYWIKLGVDPMQVLAAHLMFEPSIRPAWIVLAICFGIALAGAIRRSDARPASPRQSARPGRA